MLQKTDIIEMLTDIDTPNKYAIYNDQGKFVSLPEPGISDPGPAFSPIQSNLQMYYAAEQQNAAEFMMAQYLGDNRGFYFICTDGMGRVR